MINYNACTPSITIDTTSIEVPSAYPIFSTQIHTSNRRDIGYVDVQALQEKVARLEKDLNTLKSVFSWLFDDIEDEKSQS